MLGTVEKPARRHRKYWLATAALGLALSALPLAGWAAGATVALQIAPQDLKSALEAFVRQTNAQTLYASEIVSGRRTAGVHGDYTPAEALRLLLLGTGLTVAPGSDEGSFAIVAAPAASAAGQASGITTAAPPAVVPAVLPDGIETVTIFARGETRQVQSITGQKLLEEAPGTNPLKAIAELPGVSFNSADPLGAYEWGSRISVRAFNQNQLGFTLDDVPLGDMSYRNWNGLHIGRALIDENLGRATIAQGTSSLGMASTSNLGGTVQFFSADLPDKWGATVRQSLGSDDARRTYARFDSGLLPGDIKASLSVMDQEQNKWKGSGDQKQFQINGKFTKQFGDSTLSAFLNYSDRDETDYQDLSREYVRVLGYNWDNYGNWQQALNAARGLYSQGETKTSDPLDAAYYAGSGLRRDLLTGGTLTTALTDQLTWKTTFYGHQDNGFGLWFTPYQASPNGSPISLRGQEFTIARWGAETALTYETERNTLSGGLWYERNNSSVARRFYATSLSGPVYALDAFPQNAFLTAWNYHTVADTFQGFLQDSYKLTDSLTASAGFKGTDTFLRGKQTQGSGFADGQLQSGSPFLPQAGVNWKVTPDDEIFADIARNMRAFKGGGPGVDDSPFQMSQATFDLNKSSLKPETSVTEEIGYRLKRDSLTTDVSAYHVHFADRLLAVAQCSGIVGCPNALVNVGGVTTNGVELAASWHFLPNFTWYNGASYNNSTYDDDVISGGQRYHTKGKTPVDSPDFTYKTDIGYQKDGFFSHLTGDYLSKRYYTYTNDNAVPGRMLWDFNIGYAFQELGPLRELSLQFNIVNLFDQKYYSAIGTNGFVLSDPAGQYQTLQVGAPRAFFGTIRVTF